MADYSIAIKIAGELASSFKSSLKGAQSGLSGLAGIAGKLGSTAMKGAAVGIGAAATAAAGLGAAAVNVGSDFESAMSSVAATSGVVGDEYDKLEAAAREMGRTTSKTASEAANALEYMALAGWDVDTSISGLPSVLKLSEASGMDLARASDLVTDSMASLGISVKELPNYLDVAARAQNKSNQSAEQLMDAYLNVGGTMKDLAVPIEESAAALGVMANRGRKGGEAGQALSAIVSNLTTGTGQAGKMMDKLGISAFDSKDKFIGLQETLQVVNGALKGTTDKERNAALAALGGKEHVKDLNRLLDGLNTTNKDGVTEWDALTKELKNCDGALETMAKRKMDNLKGDLAELSSAASDLGISFYKDAGGPLRELTQVGTGMINQLNRAYQSGGLAAMLTEVGNCAAQAVNGIAQYAPMAVNVGIDLLQSLINGIVQNSAGIASAAGEVLTAFAGGIFQLAPQIAFAGIDMIVQLADSLTAQAPQLLSSGAQAIAIFVDGLIQRGPDVANAALGLIQALITGIVSNAPTLMASAVQLAGSLFTGFMQMLPQITDIGVQLIENLKSGVQSSLPALIPAAMNALASFSGSLRANVGKLVDAGLGLITALAQSMIANIPVFVQTIPTIVTNIAGIINDNAPKLLATGIQLIVQLAAGIIQAVPVIISNLPQIVQAIVSVFTAFNWVSLGSKVITFIGNGIKAAIGSIPQIFSNFVQTAHNIVSSFGWQSLGRGIITLISNGISSMITTIPQIFMNLGSFAVQAFKSIDWWGVGTAVIQLIGEAISGAGGFIVDAVKGIGGGIIDGIKGIFGGGDADASDSGTQAAESYAAGIESNAAAASSAVSTVSSTAFGSMDFTAATAAGTQSADAFSTGLTDGLAGLSVNTSGIGLDNAALAADFGQAGADGAAALGDSLDAGLTVASADTGTQMAQITTAVQDNMAQADSAVQQSMGAMVSTVQGSGTQMVQAATSAAQGVKSAFSGIDLSQSATNMMQGLINGINARRPQVEAAARDVAQAAASSVNSALQIHSPSRLMDKSGRFVDEGFAGGMLKNAGMVKSAAQAAMAQPVTETGVGMQDSMSRPFSDMRAGMQGGGRVRSALDWIISSSTANNRTENNSSVASPTFVFSPTINVSGGAAKDDVVQAVDVSRDKVEKWVKDMMRRHGREQFA